LAKRAGGEEWEFRPGEEAEVASRLRHGLRDVLETATGGQPPADPSRFPFRRMAALAAGVLMALGAAWYFQRSGSVPPAAPEVAEVRQAWLREHPNRLVIRADGRDFSVDSLAVGEEAEIGGTAVKRLSDNGLAYLYLLEEDRKPSGHVLFVPKGRDFNVTLPDGTSVWLNTGSVLAFPERFTGGERRVSLSGEAFFEVVADKSNPFAVRSGGMEVTATGTQFHVMAYPGEEDRTATLITGKVRVSAGRSAVRMKAGRQAVWREGTSAIATAKANTAGIIAKRNGYFAFYEQDIRSIMKEVGRWYDVEAVFQGEIPDRLFGGTFSRHRDLDELLEYFTAIGGFTFEQKGRRVIVMSP